MSNDARTELDGLIRIYPAAAPTGAALVWAHGGGFTGGDLDMPESHWFASEPAARGVTVIAVGYRLAPRVEPSGEPDRHIRAHFPAGSDDLLTAWNWMLDHSGELDLDLDRTAIGGASAGGNLAAGAVLRLLAAGDPSRLPSRVFLAYPTLHAVQAESGPAEWGFEPDAVHEMYRNYLGADPAHAPSAAIPGTASVAEVAGFPPTLMINDELDSLRFSGEAFAELLRATGTHVEVDTVSGVRHGHLNVPGDIALESVERVGWWVRG